VNICVVFDLVEAFGAAFSEVKDLNVGFVDRLDVSCLRIDSEWDRSVDARHFNAVSGLD